MLRNIFENDAFSSTELTEAINLAPYVPSRIGSMGLFTAQPIRTKFAEIERKGDVVSLLPVKNRKARETTKRASGFRDTRIFKVPYIPLDDEVSAGDVSGIREFGEEDQLEMMSTEVADRLANMRQSHEVTHEYHRLGALRGVVLDADGTTEIFNFFDEFGLTRAESYFDLDNPASNIKQHTKDIVRHIEGALGAATYNHVHALCGDDFYDKFTQHPDVVDAMITLSSLDPRWLVDNQGTGTPPGGSFEYGGVIFENYRGKIGDIDFIDPAEAHFFPVGLPGLFKVHFSPAETMDFVNTLGQEVYSMQEPLKFNEGMELHTESNPLHICTRPRCLVLGHAGPEGS